MRKKLMCLVIVSLLITNCYSQGLSRQLSPYEVQTYLANFNDVFFRSKKAAEEEFIVFERKYRPLPDIQYNHLKELITECEERKVLLDYMQLNALERLVQKEKLNDLYQDSIAVCLMKYKDEVAGGAIRKALGKAKEFGFDSTLCSKIINTGLLASRLVRKNPCADYERMVMDTLRSILTEKQLVRVLRSKNLLSAYSKFSEEWQYAIDTGLVVNEDRNEYFNSAAEYYLNEMVIRDMYVGYDDIIQTNLSALYKRQPLFVRIIESARSKEKLKNKQAKKQINNNKTDMMAW